RRALQARAYPLGHGVGWSKLGESRGKRVKRVPVEEHERDALEIADRLGDRADRDSGGAVDGKTESTGRDGRERDRAAAEARCEPERSPWARREQLVLAVAAAAPNGPDRMDDEAGRQAPGGRRLGFTRVAASEQAALVEDGRAPGAMDRAVDPA